MPQNKLMVKVALFTHTDHLVTEVYTLPFKFWPQCLTWGQRIFVREDFKSNVACEQDEPPRYYEVGPVAAFDAQDLAEAGIV